MTFSPDTLDRRKIANYLKTIVEKRDIFTTTTSLVVAVNSPWGTGKSTFVEQFKEYIENGRTQVVVYNAWENDDYDSPFESIVYELLKQVSSDSDKGKEQIKEVAMILGKCFGKGVFQGVMKKFLCVEHEQSEKILQLFSGIVDGDKLAGELTVLRQDI